jgi:hypothetical protein
MQIFASVKEETADSFKHGKRTFEFQKMAAFFD